MNWKALVREPLLHFLLIGVALFLIYGQASPGGSDSRKIVVSQGQVDAMVGQFQGARNRAPTSSEISGLIDSYVRDEIIYREGRALGLQEDDAVIKRRIRQKYDLIAEEQGRTPPTDAELTAYMKAHPDSFRRAAIVSFDQIYFDPASNNPQQMSAAKAVLENGGSPAAFGSPSMLPSKIVDSSIQLVANDFGDQFAVQIGNAPVGKWVGPLVSGYGVHLVRVNKRSAASLPPLAEIRAQVLREWESDRRSRSREEDYRKLRDEYEVIVEAKLAPEATP